MYSLQQMKSEFDRNVEQIIYTERVHRVGERKMSIDV